VSRAPLTLAGRTAVITGAGSGIGRALALRAAAEGMAVAACDVDAAGLTETERLLGEAGAQNLTRVLDVTSEGALPGFAREVAGALPSIALLFANAGILRQGGVIEMPIGDWERVFAINVLGAIRTVQAFAPIVAAPGQIVITGSTGSMSHHPGLAAYCGTKHALWPIAELLRTELAEQGIGVSLLMPGAVATHIFAQAAPDRETPADSITPDAAAVIAFAGAVADKALILTHPHFVERAKARFDGVIEGLA
jgi:NAD(P)-dependent dehydrogenase (short-subunit alcohol dehydrogenase family)